MSGQKANHPQEYEQILDTCLNLVERGQETLETVLDRYPEATEALRPPLEAAAWLFSRRKVLDPRPGFLPVSKRRMVDRFQYESGYFFPSQGQRKRIRANAIFQKKYALQLSLLAGITVILLVMGLSSFSFLIEKSLPGDAFYSLKRSWEETSLGLSLTKSGDARLQVELVQRRLNEIETILVLNQVEHLGQARAGLESQFDAALKAIAAASQEDRKEAAAFSDSLVQTLSTSIDFIQVLMEEVTGEQAIEIHQTYDSALEDLARVQSFQHSIGLPSPLNTFPLPFLENTPSISITTSPSDLPAMIGTLSPFQTVTPNSTVTPVPSEGERSDDRPEKTEKPKPEHTQKPKNTHHPEQQKNP